MIHSKSSKLITLIIVFFYVLIFNPYHEALAGDNSNIGLADSNSAQSRDPFERMESIKKRIEALQKELYYDMTQKHLTPDIGAYSKMGNAIEDKGDYYSINIELAGMDENELKIETKGKYLYIQGEQKTEKEEKDEGFLRKQSSFGSFSKVLPLPDDADTQNITTEYKNPVFTVTIPKLKSSSITEDKVPVDTGKIKEKISL